MASGWDFLSRNQAPHTDRDVYKRQVTHSHEIVDLMKKRVITIDRGMVVCDEEESGYHYED